MGELIDKAKGKIKRFFGGTFGNTRMSAEGRAGEMKGETKEVFERAKQKARDARDPNDLDDL